MFSVRIKAGIIAISIIILIAILLFIAIKTKNMLIGSIGVIIAIIFHNIDKAKSFISNILSKTKNNEEVINETAKVNNDVKKEFDVIDNSNDDANVISTRHNVRRSRKAN